MGRLRVWAQGNHSFQELPLSLTNLFLIYRRLRRGSESCCFVLKRSWIIFAGRLFLLIFCPNLFFFLKLAFVCWFSFCDCLKLLILMFMVDFILFLHHFIIFYWNYCSSLITLNWFLLLLVLISPVCLFFKPMTILFWTGNGISCFYCARVNIL